MSPDWDVIIVGGGAAGLMAASFAAERGRRTLVLEKNRKLGVKILMSGGTRCNITHDCSPKEIAEAFRIGGKFLYKALGQFPPESVIAWFEAEGVLTKVEATGKVFPVSDKAIDVRDALVRHAEAAGATIRAQAAVKDIKKNESTFQVETDHSCERCSALILTTGGKSYPGCGTVGDGYGWAKQFGHAIENTHAALTPLTTNEAWVHELSGLTLPDVDCWIRVRGNNPPIEHRRGAVLFTHTGLSGPEPMNLSRYVTAPDRNDEMEFVLNLSGEKNVESLLEKWKPELANPEKRTATTLIPAFVPKRLVDAICTQIEITPQKRLAEISRAELRRLAMALSQLVIPISGTRGFDKAEVTAGGVRLNEVDKATMQSKLVSRLYFAGEILNLDGPIGGFNFQAAFATGAMAGRNA
ncbi:MAG: aminoacetone oxidase family FAD-binding enzyme [Pirellulaceae bacterium]